MTEDSDDRRENGGKPVYSRCLVRGRCTAPVSYKAFKRAGEGNPAGIVRYNVRLSVKY